MTRVLFFGTHPYCYNGYCIVTYNLAKHLANNKDIDLTVYGFQNFYNNPQHMKEREIPPNVYVYDAWANENPKQMGFGFDQVAEFVSMNKPDVVVIYNDMVVVSNILNKLKDVKRRTFKTIVYIDQVYLYQKKDYVNKLNEEADYVLCFTPYWETIAKGIGINKPTGYLQHGFDKKVHYPAPKPLARQYYGLKKDDFIVLNLNRNQPRKRWDTCLQAYTEFVSKHMNEPVKLLIATAVQGAWNLLEVYERELNKRGFTLEQGMKHIILIDNPQQLTDEEINILYNLADVGINTCDGEGFGLCNFEQGAIGTPQIVPAIGGFLDFFNKDNSIMIDPKLTFYIDGSRDGVGGEAQLCDWRDFAAALETYYANPELRKKHGEAARKKILTEYRWEDLANKFANIVHEVAGKVPTDATRSSVPVGNVSTISLDSIKELDGMKNLNITSLKTTTEEPKKRTVKKKVVTKEPVAPESDKKKEELRERLRSKLAVKKSASSEEGAALDKEALLQLKSKIDQLLKSS